MWKDMLKPKRFCSTKTEKEKKKKRNWLLYKENKQKLGNEGERRKARRGRRKDEKEAGWGGRKTRQDASILEPTEEADKKQQQYSQWCSGIERLKRWSSAFRDWSCLSFSSLPQTPIRPACVSGFRGCWEGCIRHSGRQEQSAGVGVRQERDQQFCDNRNSEPEIILKRLVWQAGEYSSQRRPHPNPQNIQTLWVQMQVRVLISWLYEKQDLIIQVGPVYSRVIKSGRWRQKRR